MLPQGREGGRRGGTRGRKNLRGENSRQVERIWKAGMGRKKHGKNKSRKESKNKEEMEDEVRRIKEEVKGDKGGVKNMS